MAPVSKKRKYDFVLLGATGYTGKLCAEYITVHLPTTINWAIAGRSEHKLLDLLINLKNLNADRKQPDIEVADLTPARLARLAQNTTLLINTVGPYHLYSSPVISACAENGTHYLDVTGEAPWVFNMIRKNHALAKKNHAILIPQIGMESAPSDLLVWVLADLLRKNGCTGGIKEATGSLHELHSAPSGGTLATALGLFDAFSVKEMAAGTKWAHSPVPPPKPSPSFPSLLGSLFGTRTIPGLGTVTTSITASPNIATVQRSWGLLDKGKFYGPHFQYKEYMAVRSTLVGCLTHLSILAGMILLAFPPVRWLLTKVVYAPGQGPERESTKGDFVEHRCVAVGEGPDGKEKRALARFRYEGGMYIMSGTLLAEGAMCILQNIEGPDGGLEGGLLTPACLGEALVERLRGAGFVIEGEMLD